MINYRVLEQFETTNERLREVLSAEMPSEARKATMLKKLGQSEFDKEMRRIKRDIANREKFEKQIQGMTEEHILCSLKNHHRYSAIDIAWDSCPINKRILPLMLYAQGRIDTAQAEKSLQALPDGQTYVKKGATGTYIDLPKFTEVNVNLIRSVVTRRVAAQAVKYDKLWPHFKYESRDQTQVGKLRADMTSQRMDIMADQYGYRHTNTQSTRDMLLYTKSIAFPRASWERDVQIEINPSVQEVPGEKLPVRTRVVREGIAWVNPHPSRVFYDNNYPITTLNTDTGCEYVGFWDVARWGDIAADAQYFNRKSVSFSADSASWFASYAGYFSQYYKEVVSPIPPQADSSVANDAKANVGIYNASLEHTSVFFTHLWRKIIPQEWGIGKYPHPVWVHLKVAGDNTVIYADICPSSPAAVFEHNANDNRQSNISLAEELMPYQDQLTNLFSTFLEIVKADLFSVGVLNTDVFPDTPEGRAVRDDFKKIMAGEKFYTQTQVLEISFEKLRQLNINPGDVFKVVRSHPNTALNNVLEAITTTIAMAERNQVMSQHEQGQVAPHEISATESVQLAGSTETIFSFISNSIDEGRAAMKRICYESMIAKGSDDVTLYVTSRYPKSVIEKAGFVIKEDDGEMVNGWLSVMGKKMSLVHDYIFTSRDGGDRASNSAAANTLVQLLTPFVTSNPAAQSAILSAMGKEKLFELMNEIFRLADAGVSLRLETKPGEDDEIMPDESQQVISLIQNLANQLRQVVGDVQQLKQIAGVQTQGAPPMQPEPT